MVEKETRTQKRPDRHDSQKPSESLGIVESVTAVITAEHETALKLQVQRRRFQNSAGERILEELSKESPGSVISQTELARRLGVSKQAIYQSIAKLKARGYKLPIITREYLDEVKKDRDLTRIQIQIQREQRQQDRAALTEEVKRLRFEQKLGNNEIAERLGKPVYKINNILSKLMPTDSSLRIKRKRRTQAELASFDEQVKPLYEADLTYDQIAARLDSTKNLVEISIVRMESKEELSFRGRVKKTDEIEVIRRLRKEDKLGNIEIAERLGIRIGRVHEILKRLKRAGEQVNLKDVRN